MAPESQAMSARVGGLQAQVKHHTILARLWTQLLGAIFPIPLTGD